MEKVKYIALSLCLFALVGGCSKRKGVVSGRRADVPADFAITEKEDEEAAGTGESGEAMPHRTEPTATDATEEAAGTGESGEAMPYRTEPTGTDATDEAAGTGESGEAMPHRTEPTGSASDEQHQGDGQAIDGGTGESGEALPHRTEPTATDATEEAATDATEGAATDATEEAATGLTEEATTADSLLSANAAILEVLQGECEACDRDINLVVLHCSDTRPSQRYTVEMLAKDHV